VRASASVIRWSGPAGSARGCRDSGGALSGSAVIERCRRREESVGEASVDMYPAGVSTGRVDDTGQALRGERMPSRTLSDKLRKVCRDIDRWRPRPLSRPYPYVSVDGVRHRRSWGGAVESVGVSVAIGVGSDGRREVIGVAEGLTGGRRQLGLVFIIVLIGG
jgi:putative transposase